MTPGTGWIPDDAFLDRVKRAYRLAIKDFDISRMSLWRAIFSRQQPIHTALMAATNDEIRNIFVDPKSSDLFYGVDNLCAAVPSSEDGLGQFEASELRNLANALGAHTGDIVDELSKVMSVDIDFPNPFKGETGYQTSRGIASYRAIQSLYQSHLIRTTAIGRPQSVLEIGPGMGRTAYYSFRSGIRDYTTVDLPMGVVAQSCFLGATLGPGSIWMIGDGDSHDRIKLIPSRRVDLVNRRFDVVFNADSLVEMSPLQIVKYLWFIRRHARLFLSVNHEDTRIKIRQIASVILFGRQFMRGPYPIRAGYFEEVYS